MIVESFIIQHLTAVLPVAVMGEIPPGPPDNLVVVSRQGTERENHISTALIRFDCYSTSLYKSAELSATVQAAVDELVRLPEISCCEFGGDYNNSDPRQKKYCYTSMYNITYL